MFFFPSSFLVAMPLHSSKLFSCFSWQRVHEVAGARAAYPTGECSYFPLTPGSSSPQVALAFQA